MLEVKITGQFWFEVEGVRFMFPESRLKDAEDIWHGELSRMEIIAKGLKK